MGKSDPKANETFQSYLMLFFLAAGVLVSFTIFGYAQEALTRQEYGGERFRFPTFLILLQSSCNVALGSAILWMTGDKNFSGGAPMKEWLIVSTSYLGAHEFGLWALSYIPFPLQVVCKSCKALPVMAGERLLAGKKHSKEKQLQVFLMTLGVVVFTLTGGSKKGASEFALTPTLVLGLTLVLGALICDGIYGPYQTNIVKQYGSNQWHLMFNMNLYEMMFAFAICLLDGELFGAIDFIRRHPEILPRMAYFGSMMGVGSVFIYSLQREFGALTVTLTTTLRKLISIVFSVLWFGHSLQPAQWCAAFMVFLAHPIASQIIQLNSKLELFPWLDDKQAKKTAAL